MGLMAKSPYTRVDPADPDNDSKKSVLDLIIMSRELFCHVDKVTVDKERKFTPSHTLKRNKVTYPDHYAILISFKDIPKKNIKPKKPPKIVRWNTNKKNGWERYAQETTNNLVLNNIANGEVDSSDPNSVANQIEKELTKVKFKCFGKVKYRPDKYHNEVLENLYAEKRDSNDAKQLQELDKQINEELEIARKENLSNEVNKLCKIRNNRGNVAAIFKLKEAVVGSKKVSQEATTLLDPDSNEEVNSVSEIKRVSLTYCRNLLTNRNPSENFVDILKEKTEVHDQRMVESAPEHEMDLTIGMFNSALRRIKTKNAEKYAFILKGGQSFINSLFFLFKSVWSKEIIPDDWKKTNIVQIFKNKGSRQDLSMYRNIHTKVETRSMFSEIVTHELKQILTQNISKFQIGAIPGHRPQEHLFTIKSTIARYNQLGKGIILCLYDVVRFFDSENLRDCCGELHKLNIRGKIYRLIFNLNKETQIKVRTPGIMLKSAKRLDRVHPNLVLLAPQVCQEELQSTLVTATPRSSTPAWSSPPACSRTI